MRNGGGRRKSRENQFCSYFNIAYKFLEIFHRVVFNNPPQINFWKNLNKYRSKKVNFNFVELALYFFTFWLMRKSLKVYSTRIVLK